MKTLQPSLFDGLDEDALAAAGAPPAHPSAAPAPVAAGGQLSLFDDPETPAVPMPDGYSVVDTPEALAGLAARLAAAPCFALDTETTSLDPLQAGLVGLSFSCRAGEAFYVPVGHAGGRQLPLREVIAALRPVLQDAGRPKIGHNLKFDMRVLNRAGVRLVGPLRDTMIAAYLLREEGGHGLKECARVYLGREMVEFETLTGRGRRPLPEVDIPTAAAYACDDAEVTFSLWELFAPKLAPAGAEAVFDLEVRLLPVVAGMEDDGIAVDIPYLERLAAGLRAEMEQKAEQCYEAAGVRFNLNSPRQLAEVLYERLRLPVSRRNSSGASTAEGALLELAPLHPLPQRVLDYRALNKLLTTYALGLIAAVSPATGRVHPNFRQIGARSGRFSCSDPNLQNLPKDSANTIRRAFVAAPGCVLISADYSQIELRVLAHCSQDPGLLAAFAAGEDVHARTAADVFGVALDAVTPEQRRVAKGINFGLVYGMSPQGLAAQLGISLPEAERYVEAYFVRYAGVKRYIAETLRQARASGYVQTLIGRRRHVTGLRAPDGRTRGQAERQAINAPIQGTAADIIKAAMVRLAPALPPLGARMILQVHDELVIEAPEAQADAVRQAVVEAMEVPPLPGFRVPLRVEVQVGRAWK